MIPKLGAVGNVFGTATTPIVVTLHIQSSETIGQELALLKPTLVGPSTTFAIVGTPINVGATFTAGTVTARSVANPGSQLTVATMPAAAAAGMLVQNITHASYALIQSMSTSTATMDEPQTALTTVTMTPAPTEVNNWTTGDTLQLATLPILNLEPLDVAAGDTDLTNGGLWMQMLEIPDQSGEAGKSNWRLRMSGGGLAVSLVKFDALTQIDMSGSPATGAIMGCQFPGGSSFAGNVTVYGGSTLGNAIFQGPQETIQNGIAVTAPASLKSGTLTMYDTYCATTMSILDGTLILNEAGVLWGACTVNAAQPNTAFWSQADASVMLSALLISGLDAGQSADGGLLLNTFATPGTLDLSKAIFNLQTGARVTH